MREEEAAERALVPPQQSWMMRQRGKDVQWLRVGGWQRPCKRPDLLFNAAGGDMRGLHWVSSHVSIHRWPAPLKPRRLKESGRLEPCDIFYRAI